MWTVLPSDTTVFVRSWIHGVKPSSILPDKCTASIKRTFYAAAPKRRSTPVTSQQEAASQAPVAAPGEYGYTELQEQTYMGETFWKAVPPAQQNGAKWESSEAAESDAAPLQLLAMNHMALGVQDVESMTRFYTRVLGMRKLARPPFPFDGSWLEGGGILLHLIADDPTIPRKQDGHSWKERYDTEHPEPWYIRRGAHKAFAVASLEQAEVRLKQFGIEFHKFMVPGTNAAQIFLYDPEGNGIELGEGYEEIAASLIGNTTE